MRIYLAGPMSGLPSHNFPAFLAAGKALRTLGFEVFSAAEKELSEGYDPETPATTDLAGYMAVDLPEVCRADAIVLLPGWLHSKGACIEYMVADALGKPAYTYKPVLCFVDSVPCETKGVILLPMRRKPFVVAAQTVLAVEREGLKKHKQDSWADEPQQNHTLKAARHLLTQELIDIGWQNDDAENHLANACCRIAMALAKRNCKC